MKKESQKGLPRQALKGLVPTREWNTIVASVNTAKQSLVKKEITKKSRFLDLITRAPDPKDPFYSLRCEQATFLFELARQPKEERKVDSEFARHVLQNAAIINDWISFAGWQGSGNRTRLNSRPIMESWTTC